MENKNNKNKNNSSNSLVFGRWPQTKISAEPGFKPEAARWEGRLLPLFYATPFNSVNTIGSVPRPTYNYKQEFEITLLPRRYLTACQKKTQAVNMLDG